MRGRAAAWPGCSPLRKRPDALPQPAHGSAEEDNTQDNVMQCHGGVVPPTEQGVWRMRPCRRRRRVRPAVPLRPITAA